MTKTLTVKNLGPVKALEIPLAPGVTVLKGGQGVGKSTILRGADKLLGAGRSGELSAMDGAQRGEIELGDAVLRVTKAKSRKSGELEVVSIASRLDLASLVDPGIIDAEAADAKRLKALVSLSGIEGRPELFHALCGGPDEWDRLGVEATTDVILLAERVKRAFEARARNQESVADVKAGEAEAAKRQFADLDLTAESDDAKLAESYAEASMRASSMRQQNAEAERLELIVAQAHEQIEAMGEEDETQEDIRILEITARKDIEQAQASVDTARKTLAKREAALQQLKRGLEDLALRRADAGKRAHKREQLAAAASQAVPEVFPLDAIQAAEAAAGEALRAVERGAVIRRAKGHEAQAKKAADEAKRATRMAQAFRDKAGEVDLVLSKLLPPGCPLRLEKGRLVLETDRSKSEPFAELSHGERWKLGFDIVAGLLGENALVCLPQEAWEGLDRDNRRIVAEESKRRGIAVLTAEATQGALTVEAADANQG